MNTKSAIHLAVLLFLLGAWAYLWMTPVGDFKPGGVGEHLLLMLIGGILAIYILVASKRMWGESHQPVLVVNIGLSLLFIGIHLYIVTVFSFNMVTG